MCPIRECINRLEDDILAFQPISNTYIGPSYKVDLIGFWDWFESETLSHRYTDIVIIRPAPNIFLPELFYHLIANCNIRPSEGTVLGRVLE